MKDARDPCAPTRLIYKFLFSYQTPVNIAFGEIFSSAGQTRIHQQQEASTGGNTTSTSARHVPTDNDYRTVLHGYHMILQTETILVLHDLSFIHIRWMPWLVQIKMKKEISTYLLQV